ncbi:MAG: SDR family NAD(P)-dependent oxidoreductase, partial [Halioglobus sp.]
WDPAVARGEALTPGAPAAGSQFRIDMKAGFSLRYEIEEIEPEKRLLMDVKSKVFTAREEILFDAPEEGVTTVRYIATFYFSVPLATVNRLYPRAMQQVGESTMAGLQRALEGEFDAPEESRALALADKLVLPGVWRFTRLGFRQARKQWNPMSAWLGGRHVVLTGATSGIGLAAAESLALLGARLTLVVRDQARGKKVATQLRKQSGNKEIRVERCDMSLMADVHALADKLLAAGDPVDVLVNNAGALFNEREETAEGFERSFALLLLAPYILTERLQPLLAASDDGRVVNITSGGMYTQRIKVSDLQSERGKFAGAVAYARAKRGLMILTEEWANEWAEDGIAVNAMHPGWADTPGVETSLPEFYKLTKRVLRSPQEGADTAVWLAAAPEAADVSGKLWLDRQQHPAYILKRTEETDGEREQLLEELAALAEQTRESYEAA